MHGSSPADEAREKEKEGIPNAVTGGGSFSLLLLLVI